MEDHRPRPSIAANDQGPRIVAEHRPRDAPEMSECAGDPFTPVILTLAEERFHEEATGITEDRDQQKDPHVGAGDGDSLLAEIDLELVARRRFDAHGGELGHLALASQVGHRALNGPDTDGQSALGQ